MLVKNRLETTRKISWSDLSDYPRIRLEILRETKKKSRNMYVIAEIPIGLIANISLVSYSYRKFAQFNFARYQTMEGKLFYSSTSSQNIRPVRPTCPQMFTALEDLFCNIRSTEDPMYCLCSSLLSLFVPNILE